MSEKFVDLYINYFKGHINDELYLNVNVKVFYTVIQSQHTIYDKFVDFDELFKKLY